MKLNKIKEKLRETWEFYRGFRSRITVKKYLREKERKQKLYEKYKKSDDEIEKIREKLKTAEEKNRVMKNEIENRKK